MHLNTCGTSPQSFPLLLWEQTLLQGSIWEPEGQWILNSSQAIGLGFLSVPQGGMSAGRMEMNFTYIYIYTHTHIYMSMCMYKSQCFSKTWTSVAVALQSFHFKTFSLGLNLSKRISSFLEPVLGYMLEQIYEQREPISTQAVMKGSSLGKLTSLVMLWEKH